METFEQLIVFLCIFGICTAEEPKCSRFDYDKHLLEMLVRLESTMGKMAERMTEIETRFENLEQRQDVAIQTAAAELQKTVAQFETRIGTMEVNHEEQDVAMTNASIALEKRVAEIDTRVMTMEAGQERQDVAITNVSIELGKRVSRVGFFAKNEKSAQENQRPIFQTLLYNDGDSYNVSTGIFTCRVAGLYHFTFTFISMSDSSSPYCSLYLNSNRLVFTYAKGKYDSATMTVYHNLNAGDTVDVKCAPWNDIYHGSDGSMWLTGTLIRV